jgi:hypothetical protein
VLLKNVRAEWVEGNAVMRADLDPEVMADPVLMARAKEEFEFVVCAVREEMLRRTGIDIDLTSVHGTRLPTP